MSTSALERVSQRSLDAADHLTVVVYDACLRVMHVNDAARVAGAPTLDRAIGRTPSQLVGARHGARIERRLRDVLERGESSVHLFEPEEELGSGSSAGEERTMWRSHYVPVFDDEGRRVIGVTVFAVDLGEVLHEQRITESRLEQIRAEIVATVSHELRTPTAAVYGAAQTLLRTDIELSESARHQLIEIVGSESAHLAHLVEHILDANTVAAAEVFARDAVDLERVAQAVVDAFPRSMLGDVELELEVLGAATSASGDGERVRQVLVNLLDNAVKYGGSGGRVRVRVSDDGDHVRCSVRDWGPGIPSGQFERIFDRFYRLDPNHAQGVGGSGLGLYICAVAVGRMGGHIWVESPIDGGAEFILRLPKADRR